MRNISPFAVFLVVCACQAPPSVDLVSSPRASAQLELLRPVDIAVLPVEDATPERSFGDYEAVLRQRVAGALVSRRYTPLANTMVDEALSARGEIRTGSPVDAAYATKIAGAFEEDAVLGIKMVDWDVSSIMRDGRVGFAVEVLLVESEGHNVLWSGRLEGTAKSGGDGPAPVRREPRTISAVEVLADALVEQLPARRT
jgi:hypothetical protein